MSFDEHRPQLFGIAYRMLGTVMDAEDVLQDAWVRYQTLETPPEHPSAYLRKIVTNLSLDHLKSAKVQREQYIGEWLPEPILTSDDSPHEYQLYLAIENIDHTRTKARHPQTNGICERFHRTIQDEFYAIAFRKKIYTTLKELQTDLDEWVEQYNRERTHTGKHCFGRTPLQTFRETKHLAQAKQLDTLFEWQQPKSDIPDNLTSDLDVVG